MRDHIVLFALYREEFYKQALFLIVSAITFNEKTIQLHIYTDNGNWIPDNIQRSSNLVILSEEDIGKLKGNSNFIHRIKILIIKDVCSKFSGNVLYIDSDCFLGKKIDSIFLKMSKKQFIMHKQETPLSDVNHLTIHDIVNLSYREGLLAGGEEADYSMWNAGVIGGNALELLRICDDALVMTDTLLKYCTYHVLEQFAFSVCIQRAGSLSPAHEFIYHYWDTSEKNYMGQYLVHHVDIMTEISKSAYASLLSKLYLYSMEYRIRNSYTYLHDRAISNFECNYFIKGYSYSLKALLLNYELDCQFREAFKYHATRHIKHLAKLIAKRKVR